MNKFETNVCPLCGNVLRMRKVSSVSIFACPTDSEHSTSHYEVEQDTKTSVQHVYVGPWSIDSFGDSNKSRIYKRTTRPDGSMRWQMVKEIPLLRTSSQDQMLDRINKLITFL